MAMPLYMLADEERCFSPLSADAMITPRPATLR